jgi:cell division transport system permease protein
MLKSSIKINLFLKEPISLEIQEKTLGELNEKGYIDTVEFISKEQAAEQFIKETGEDFKKILDYNPLPASFVVRIDDSYANNDSLNSIINNLAEIPAVDEVVFREGFIYKMLSYIESVKFYLFLLTILVSLIAVYLVYATIKLIINSRLIDFETMKLVGAKLSTIKIPVLLNGIISGFISGILVYFIFIFFKAQVNVIESLGILIKHKIVIYYGIIFLTGPLLVLIVSMITLRKISLKI